MEIHPYASEEDKLHLFVEHGIIRLTQLNFLLLTIAVPSKSHDRNQTEFEGAILSAETPFNGLVSIFFYFILGITEL